MNRVVLGIITVTGSLMLFAGSTYALGTEYVEVTYPNGGECLVPGSEVTVTWKGEGFTHVAITHTQDDTPPPSWQQKFDVWTPNHPVYGNSHKWQVPNITSNSVMLWVEAHNDSHARLDLDNSNSFFTVSDTCGVDQPPSTIAPQLTQVIVGGTVMSPGETIEVAKGKDITLVGSAKAEETITIYVTSLEKKFSVKADSKGAWTFDIWTRNLSEGLHQVDLETASSPRSKALTFKVIPPGQTPSYSPAPPAVSVTPTPTPQSGSVTKRSGPFPYLAAVVVGAMAVIGGTVTYFLLKRRKKHLDETPTEPPKIT